MNKFISIFLAHLMILQSQTLMGASVEGFATTEGNYRFKFNNISNQIIEARDKIRKEIHPKCKYEQKLDLSGWASPAKASFNYPFDFYSAAYLTPSYANLQYVPGSYERNDIIVNNLIVHITSELFGSLNGCDYPVGTIKNKDTRSLGKMPVEYEDKKYGMQKLEIPIWMSRTNRQAIFSGEVTKNSVNQNMYSGYDFLGNQYFQVIPIYDSKNYSYQKNSIFVSVCSVHPGTTIWGDKISGSYVAYYKPHRVRHDDIATAWFTINPGRISFDGLRVCTLSKLTLRNDGTKNVEIISIKPKFMNLKWEDFSVQVDKVKTKTWLGNLGGVLGFVVGLLVGQPVAGWSIGQAVGAVGEKTFILDYLNKEVKKAIDSKVNDYLAGKTLDQLAESKAQEAINDTGFVGNILKGSIFNPAIEASIAYAKETSTDLVMSPSDLLVSRCEKMFALKIGKNKIPEMLTSGLSGICKSIAANMSVKVYPFNVVNDHDRAGCYSIHLNQKMKTDCALDASARIVFKKEIEDEMKAIFASISERREFVGASDYSKLSNTFNSLIKKYEGKGLVSEAMNLSCPKSGFPRKSKYEKCVATYINEIKPQLEKLGLESYLRQNSKESATVIITNPLKDLAKGVLK